MSLSLQKQGVSGTSPYCHSELTRGSDLLFVAILVRGHRQMMVAFRPSQSGNNISEGILTVEFPEVGAKRELTDLNAEKN